MSIDRRQLLLGGAAALTASVARAAAIPADVRAGGIADVDHVVILMQENRAFDHYFGTCRGVRGFGDRFPIPLAGAPGRTVWQQGAAGVAPFRLDSTTDFRLMRVEGTPHSWPDAQAAWDEGRMGRWPEHKHAHAMGHYAAADIPFQFALADAFTLCDAYHCSVQTGTNTNRLFLWTGTNDPGGRLGGPAIGNSHDALPAQGGAADPYRWTTYPERLQAAGIDWRVYQDMADNFGDNPLVGFHAFRRSLAGAGDPALAERGLSTRTLDGLRADVLAGRLPQVSWIVAPEAASEHPMPSSPAQGAAYTAQVIDALTADPRVWARTVLLVMFDENDGFFDHMPPPAPPSQGAGASTISTAGEYHRVPSRSDSASESPALIGRPYGLGPRVPMYVISPWSRGGWVNSQVFDHTSVLRFLAARFGVAEPNISSWRKAVCGDLTSAFDFRTPNATVPTALPDTGPAARRAAALPGRTTPAIPVAALPEQEPGTRPSRALPYRLAIEERLGDDGIELIFRNQGAVGAVFHVYDRLALDAVPRRYTVGAGDRLAGRWRFAAGTPAYDLWVLGPNGFHRHLRGAAGDRMRLMLDGATVRLAGGQRPMTVRDLAYGAPAATLSPGGAVTLPTPGGWYDIAATDPAAPHFVRRYAGRNETGAPSTSDPAMGRAPRLEPDDVTWNHSS